MSVDTAFEGIPMTTDEAKEHMPQLVMAEFAVWSHPGEAFVDFQFYKLTIGEIDATEDSRGPYVSAYPVQFSKNNWGSVNASVPLKDAIGYNLAWSGACGGWPVEVSSGVVDGQYTTLAGKNAHGDTMVFSSPSLEAGKALDRLGNAWAIGNLASGAFAISKALKEVEEKPQQVHTSLGLLVANHLEKGGVEWKPEKGQRRTAMDAAIEKLREPFMTYGLTPVALGAVGLRGSFVTAGTVARRATIFNFNVDTLATGLTERVFAAAQEEERISQAMDRQKRETEPYGDYDKFVRGAIANMLANQLGIKAQ